MGEEKRAALNAELEDWLQLAEDTETEYLGGEMPEEAYSAAMVKCENAINDLMVELES